MRGRNVELSRKQKRQMQEARNDMRELLALPAGRRFLTNLLDGCGVLSANPSLSGVAEGRRSVGLSVIDAMRAVDPQAFAKLMLEATGRETGENEGVEDETI